MMDKKYIQDNGILERYVLGDLTDAEYKQVDAILEQDTELMAECIAIEDTFETLATENAIAPKARVKDALFASLETNSTKESKVIPFEKKQKSSIFQLAAASVAIFFIASSFFLYGKWQTAESNLQVLQEETATLNNRLSVIETNLKTTETWYNAINQPEVRQLVLVGNIKSPNSKAIVYVNNTTKQVILNPQKLATLDTSKTYQMWADVDGEMINMGVIPKNQEMVKLNYIDNAESLNITIEPAGGNDHPTVEQLITNVYL